MSDEQRADVLGFAGNEVVRTPVLDRLARDAAVFRRAYTPAPICIPARQSMMSGKWPRHCGCEVYGDDLEPGCLTFPRLFSRYAYHTVACGRLDHDGPDQMQGWVRRIGDDSRVIHRYIPGLRNEEMAKVGKRQKWWRLPHYLHTAGAGSCFRHRSDEYTLTGTLNFIHEHFTDPWRPRTSQPLFLMASFFQPHYPFLTDAARFHYYEPRVQPFMEQDSLDHPRLGRTSPHYLRVGDTVTADQVRRATAAYYGMVETVDEYFGRILTALEEAGQDLDTWIIVYCSDHGEMLGEHGMWEKQLFYEGSVKVPLFIRWPERFARPQVINRNVSLCDLYATLCELAGLPVPEGLDSRSLVPLLEGESEPWNNEVISHFNRPDLDHAQLMIKRDQLKYQNYGPGLPEVLFDLDRDPGETDNCLSAPDREREVRAFRGRCRELGYGL